MNFFFLHRRIFLLVICLVAFNSGQVTSVFGLAEQHVPVSQDDLEETIQTTNAQFDAGHYIDALRRLYDVYAQTHAMQIWSVINDYASTLIHGDKGDFMQYLRNPQISIQERSRVLDALADAAKQNATSVARLPVWNADSNPLIRIMTAPQLSSEEKSDFLQRIDAIVRTMYVSATEKSQMLQEIETLETQAIAKFEAQQYAEAFHLLFQAGDKSDMLRLGSDETTVPDQVTTWLVVLAGSEPSSLMQMLRNREMPLSQKTPILKELQTLSEQGLPENQRIHLQGYTQDPIVQLFSSSLLSVHEKLFILGYIEEVITSGYSPVP